MCVWGGDSISSFYQYLSVLLCVLQVFDILRKIILLSLFDIFCGISDYVIGLVNTLQVHIILIFTCIQKHILTVLASGPFHKNAFDQIIMLYESTMYVQLRFYMKFNPWIHFVRETKHFPTQSCRSSPSQYCLCRPLSSDNLHVSGSNLK